MRFLHNPDLGETLPTVITTSIFRGSRRRSLSGRRLAHSGLSDGTTISYHSFSARGRNLAVNHPVSPFASYWTVKSTSLCNFHRRRPGILRRNGYSQQSVLMDPIAVLTGTCYCRCRVANKQKPYFNGSYVYMTRFAAILVRTLLAKI